MFPTKKTNRRQEDYIAGILQYERPCRNGRGVDMVDFSEVRIVHAGFDTVESLYRGDLNEARVEVFANFHERQRSEGVFDPVIRHCGYDWIVRPASKASGCRWMLVNNELGLIVFFASTFTKGTEGQGVTHLKIRAAPQFLLERSDAECVRIYDEIATSLLENSYRYACAPHFCVDMVGIDVPEDLLERLSSRCKVPPVVHKGIASLAFEGTNVAASYGGTQSFRIGSRKQIQLAIYDKTQAAYEQDRVNLWRGVWSSNWPEYDGEKVVRIEYRVHHDVMLQFERGSGVNLRDQVEVGQQLRNVFLKCLNTIRLDQGSYVDPFWQFMAEEVTDFGNPDFLDLKRHYSYSPGSSYDRKVIYAVSYCISVWVAQGLRYDAIWWKLLHAGLWGPFEAYCIQRDIDPRESLRRRIQKKILQGEGNVHAAPGHSEDWLGEAPNHA